MISGDLVSGIVGGLNTAYNLYTNKRDFDYQKALQQTMFEREDTAVQRRMADLQAAGLNPNLAAGSTAGAGAVVSRSNTNDVNMGSALDMVQAINTIRQQKQQTNNARLEGEILNNQAFDSLINKKLNYAQVMAQLGFNPKLTVNSDGSISVNPEKNSLKFQDTPLGKLLDYNVQTQGNSATLLQKDLDFYNYDKISEYLMPFLKLLGIGRK